MSIGKVPIYSLLIKSVTCDLQDANRALECRDVPNIDRILLSQTICQRALASTRLRPRGYDGQPSPLRTRVQSRLVSRSREAGWRRDAVRIEPV